MRCAWFLVLLVGCDAKYSDSGESPVLVSEGELTVLSYNVHGLPVAITGDDTAGRMIDIAPRLGAWDILGLQEDWDANNHSNLIAQVEHETRLWFDEVLEDRFYGAGIDVLARYPVLSQRQAHYTTCSGITDGASDCLASKGFQALRLDLGGPTVDVYNTHFEAGGGAEDNAARAVQVAEVIDSLRDWSAGQAVVFTGDFNLRWSDPEDVPLLELLAEEGELIDSCEAVGCEETDHIDRVFYRNGDNVEVDAISWANLSNDFLDSNGVDLSDHPPISATLAWRAVD
jgi:endonuclease/exonuclease/phosphatase family metal-dependent hydrolase